MTARRRAVIFAAFLAITTLFDQTSKAWARTLPVSPPGCSKAAMIAQQCGGVPQPVIDGYWDWELAYNTGIAFSTFAAVGGGRVVLSIIAMLALVGIVILAKRTRPEQRLQRVGLALIAGGALGNLIDRVRDGAVTDFVHWHVHDHMYPIFNVADVALWLGAIAIVAESALAHRRRRAA